MSKSMKGLDKDVKHKNGGCFDCGSKIPFAPMYVVEDINFDGSGTGVKKLMCEECLAPFTKH